MLVVLKDWKDWAISELNLMKKLFENSFHLIEELLADRIAMMAGSKHC